MLKKIITNDIQPWMRHVGRTLTRLAAKLKVKAAMTDKPSKVELKNLKEKCLT